MKNVRHGIFSQKIKVGWLGISFELDQTFRRIPTYRRMQFIQRHIKQAIMFQHEQRKEDL